MKRFDSIKPAQSISAIRPEVRNLSAYTLIQVEHEIKANQNESPFDIPVELKKQVFRYAETRSWSRYPKLVPTEFIEELAKYTTWYKEGILIGNGSDEILQILTLATIERGNKVVMPAPTYGIYKLLSSSLGAQVLEVPLNADYTFKVDRLLATVQRETPQMVFICSPNNPTGCVIHKDELRLLLSSTKALIVVDEAYYEFSGSTCLPLLEKYDNLLILRTFSKAFSLAGLRVGYLLAHPDLVKEIAKVKMPYNLNFFSIAAATLVLQHRELLQQRVEYIRQQRDRVFRQMQKIPGVKPYPSEANFILFELDKDVKLVFQSLLKEGILIRDVSHYPMLSKALRVSIGLEEENTRFLECLRKAVTEEIIEPQVVE